VSGCLWGVRMSTALEWSVGAACRGSEGSLFYSADSAERKEDRTRARAVGEENLCGLCGADDCLHAALERRESYGIWRSQ